MHQRELQQGQLHDRLLAGPGTPAVPLLNLVLAGRLVVALVLAVAGARKLTAGGRAQLAVALRDYGIVPSGWTGAVARVLPGLELSLGVLLGAGVLLVPASLCASMLLGAFGVAVAWHARRGRSFDCGCGSGGTISWSLAVRDMVLSLIAAAVAVYPRAALAVWVGPGWVHPVSGSLVSLVPVPMAVLLLAVGLRLVSVALPFVARPDGHADVPVAV